MSQQRMNAEELKRSTERPLPPGRVRVEISETNGEAKVDAAEAFSDLARATLARVKIAIPGGPPLDGTEAFSIGYTYHETGFELTVAPRIPVFRKALIRSGSDVIDSARNIGSPLPLFHRMVLGAAKLLAPESYARGHEILLTLLARELAMNTLGVVMTTMKQSNPTVGPETSSVRARAPAP